MVQERLCSSLHSQLRKTHGFQPLKNIHIVIAPSFISCPYVTAVGSTIQINPEIAASFSGGGFSRYFSTPAYQAKAVSKYLKGLGSKYAGLYK